VKKIVNIYTAGIVILTLVVNGMAAGVVYKKLRPYPGNDYQEIIAGRVLKMLGAELLYIVEDVKDHWFHRHASWDAVKDFAPDFEQVSVWGVRLLCVCGVWCTTVCCGECVGGECVEIC
jgi:hypothetical protein